MQGLEVIAFDYASSRSGGGSSSSSSSSSSSGAGGEGGGAVPAPARAAAAVAPVLVGVVASGNLEVLFEPAADAGGCSVRIETSARGYGAIWRAVLDDFVERHAPVGLAISINDMGATPAVVALRLEQAATEWGGAA